jgi:quercetin dioxygenase-like cupin family protein
VSVSSDSTNPPPHVLLRSEETDGRIALIESTMPARAAGPPLHTHAFDETFFVLAGELTFQLGDEVRVARAGEVAFALGGVSHTLANHPRSRTLVVCSPLNNVRDVVNGRDEDAVSNTAVDRIRAARGQATAIAGDATERSTMNTTTRGPQNELEFRVERVFKPPRAR